MEITNYDRFNELETPALVLNSDGSVAYRNKVAEVLARYIRRVSDMAEVFPDAPDALKNCIFQGQTAIVTVQLGRECRSPALLIPDGCRNTQRAILFCSPFFKEESAAEPDRGPEKNIHTNSRVKRPEGGEYRVPKLSGFRKCRKEFSDGGCRSFSQPVCRKVSFPQGLSGLRPVYL